MAYGFRIFNNGKVTVDDMFPNLMVVEKGTLSLSSGYLSRSTIDPSLRWTRSHYDTMYVGYIPYPNFGDHVFYEVTAGRRVFHVKYGWSTEIKVESNHQSIRWVRARYMRYLPAPPAGSFGLFVKDEEGNYTYSSSENFLTITGLLSRRDDDDSALGNGIWVSPDLSQAYGNGGGDGAGIPYEHGAENFGGKIFPRGYRVQSTNYVPARTTERIRGLIADINWNDV